MIPFRRLPALALLSALGLAACEGGPGPGPGTLTASVVSPHGAEGAAVLELHGPGIQGVSAASGWVFGEPGGGDTVSVVVVADDAGLLTFRVQVADTLQRLQGRVVQVAGPDDALRDRLEEYRVEVVR